MRISDWSSDVCSSDLPIGVATADANGRWTLKPEKSVDPGIYSLRVDQVEQAGGKVASRVEMPFSRARPEDIQFDAQGKSVVVQPGNSLWRLARHIYGEGLRYTDIYKANQTQIRRSEEHTSELQ